MGRNIKLSAIILACLQFCPCEGSDTPASKQWVYFGGDQLKRCLVSPFDGMFENCVNENQDDIVYSVTSGNGNLYINSGGVGNILACDIEDNTGKIDFCAGKKLDDIYGSYREYRDPLIFAGDERFYIVEGGTPKDPQAFFTCDIQSGKIGDCVEAQNFNSIKALDGGIGYDMFAKGKKVYMARYSGDTSYVACDISSDGTSLTNCFNTGPDYISSDGSTIWGDFLYLIHSNNEIFRCLMTDSGDIVDCQQTGPSSKDIRSITANDNFLYMAAYDEMMKCDISETDGLLGNCIPATKNTEILEMEQYFDKIAIYPGKKVQSSSTSSAPNGMISHIFLLTATLFSLTLYWSIN